MRCFLELLERVVIVLIVSGIGMMISTVMFGDLEPFAGAWGAMFGWALAGMDG